MGQCTTKPVKPLFYLCRHELFGGAGGFCAASLFLPRCRGGSRLAAVPRAAPAPALGLGTAGPPLPGPDLPLPSLPPAGRPPGGADAFGLADEAADVAVADAAAEVPAAVWLSLPAAALLPPVRPLPIPTLLVSPWPLAAPPLPWPLPLPLPLTLSLPVPPLLGPARGAVRAPDDRGAAAVPRLPALDDDRGANGVAGAGSGRVEEDADIEGTCPVWPPTAVMGALWPLLWPLPCGAPPERCGRSSAASWSPAHPACCTAARTRSSSPAGRCRGTALLLPALALASAPVAARHRRERIHASKRRSAKTSALCRCATARTSSSTSADARATACAVSASMPCDNRYEATPRKQQRKGENKIR